MSHEKPFQPHGEANPQHAHGEPFTAAELAHFQAEDRHAGRAIITLMTSVFALGCVGV